MRASRVSVFWQPGYTPLTHAAASLSLPDDIGMDPAARREQRLAQLVRMPHTPVTFDDGRTADVAASVAAAPDVIGARDLTRLQRAADAALYDGKHSGRAILAGAAHTSVPSVSGRRAGRPGTAVWGRVA